MKIGLITVHCVHNAGSVLQCAALYKTLTQNGHEVCIINYRPKYLMDRRRVFQLPFKPAKERFCQLQKKGYSLFRSIILTIKTFASTILKNTHIVERVKRTVYYNRFVAANLKETKVYRTYDKLLSDPPVCDVYISGSDQLWNKYITDNHFDLAYFIDFGNARKRVIYGMSIGETSIKEIVDFMDQRKCNIDSLSFRESVVSRQFSMLKPNIPVCTVPDPTVLLNTEDYADMESPISENEEFLLLYTLESNKLINAIIEKYMAINPNIKVIDVSPYDFFHNKNITRVVVGPGMFLSYIKHARYIITNSFHGTMMSILYNKIFISVPHTTRGARIRSVLDSCKLNTRLVNSIEDWSPDLINPIDYTYANDAIMRMRSEGLHFLNEALVKGDVKVNEQN